MFLWGSMFVSKAENITHTHTHRISKRFVCGVPPFVGPKNIRFRHGFKRNLKKDLIFAIFRFIVSKIQVYVSPWKPLKVFGPFVGSMFVSQA